MNTALNRTTLAFLTNKSGGDLAYGDVVVLDNSNANGFTTTTTAGLSTRGLGVIFDVAGIANNATGAVAIGGWCPQVNLNAAATVGQFVKTHTVAGQATPHSSPQVEGDFGVALTASATPPALLFGSANPPGGSGSGTVTNTGTLTDHALIVGNGGVDVSALGSLGTTTTVLHGNAAGDPTFAAVSLTADVSGDLPFANLAQIAGLSVLGVTGSATADVAAITAGTDGQVLTRVSSSSLAFAQPGFALIEQQTPTGTGTITFSSLGAFTHLQIKFSIRSTEVATESSLTMQLNADTGSNYDNQRIRSHNTTNSTSEGIAETSALVALVSAASAPSAVAGTGTIDIFDYLGTTLQKGGTFHAQYKSANASDGQNLWTGAWSWRSASAITSITLALGSGNYAAGSKITLYGLR